MLSIYRSLLWSRVRFSNDDYGMDKELKLWYVICKVKISTWITNHISSSYKNVITYLRSGLNEGLANFSKRTLRSHLIW